MKFNLAQFEKFGTFEGAYSLVTEREFADSQITATGAETILLEKFFAKSGIHVGNKKTNPQAASKMFRLYPDGNVIHLNLLFPKPDKTELRLYLSKGAGFKPNPGKVWFLFVKDNDIWIGALEEQVWREENSLLRNEQDVDEEFQDTMLSLKNVPSANALAMIKRWKRDPRIAKRRMEESKYKCEYDPKHNLFLAKRTGVPYLEAHHLIPISLQPRFPKNNLDNLRNVCCLCPFCHSAVHHAEYKFVRNVLTKLSEKHKPVLVQFNVTLQDILQFYSVEEIVD
ncbi:MAG: HNH endonuclease [Kiritimatiellae bacterium]|nr:HNH endonuclease [Kiritimatiellia bacterium]